MEAEVREILAAIASVHDAAVATRNTGDFTGLGVSLIDPWTEAAGRSAR